MVEAPPSIAPLRTNTTVVCAIVGTVAHTNAAALNEEVLGGFLWPIEKQITVQRVCGYATAEERVQILL